MREKMPRRCRSYLLGTRLVSDGGSDPCRLRSLVVLTLPGLKRADGPPKQARVCHTEFLVRKGSSDKCF